MVGKIEFQDFTLSKTIRTKTINGEHYYLAKDVFERFNGQYNLRIVLDFDKKSIDGNVYLNSTGVLYAIRHCESPEVTPLRDRAHFLPFPTWKEIFEDFMETDHLRNLV